MKDRIIWGIIYTLAFIFGWNIGNIYEWIIK